LRPTSGKTRETLFNWLQFDIDGKTILDPFTGSGALGIEAISRGAEKVYFIEKNYKVYNILKSNLKIFNSSQYKLINQDSLVHLEKENLKPFDIVFLDPPFNQGLLPGILTLISKKKLINSKSKIYVESGHTLTAEFLSSNIMYKCKIEKQKKSGNVYYCLISLEDL
jgi:16S rRNA (guanine966-N2)-methyltransferase